MLHCLDKSSCVTVTRKQSRPFNRAMSRNLVLIVDPDEAYIQQTTTALYEVNLDVVSSQRGEDARKDITALEPAIILTEVELPDMSGFDLCRYIKSNRPTSDIPLVFVTERSEEIDRVVGFELGATDYVIKPVNFRELSLRVLRILQRLGGSPRSGTMRIGRLVVDFEQAMAHRNGRRLDLSPTEFQILAALARARGRVLTRSEIITSAWNDQSPVMARTVDAHVKSLRRKLIKTELKLATIRGTGYCLRYDSFRYEETKAAQPTPGISRVNSEISNPKSDREFAAHRRNHVD